MVNSNHQNQKLVFIREWVIEGVTHNVPVQRFEAVPVLGCGGLTLAKVTTQAPSQAAGNHDSRCCPDMYPLSWQ